MYDSDTVSGYGERTEDAPCTVVRMRSGRTTNVTRELVFSIGRRAHHSMLIKIKVCETGGYF